MTGSIGRKRKYCAKGITTATLTTILRIEIVAWFAATPREIAARRLRPQLGYGRLRTRTWQDPVQRRGGIGWLAAALPPEPPFVSQFARQHAARVALICFLVVATRLPLVALTGSKY
jgi:hypothetical protein